jgi:hypothetical protein
MFEARRVDGSRRRKIVVILSIICKIITDGEHTLVTSHEWVLDSEGKREIQQATTVVLTTTSELASGVGCEHRSGEQEWPC